MSRTCPEVKEPRPGLDYANKRSLVLVERPSLGQIGAGFILGNEIVDQ